MNEQPILNPPEPPQEEWETAVHETARSFPYPATPDIAAGVRQRLRSRPRRLNPIWRVAIAAVLVLLIVILAVPEVRAVVLDFIQIGALRIFSVTPTATRAPHSPTPTPGSFFGSQTPLASALDMPGETTLDDARAKSRFQFGLPTYPADLGAPDHVYLQDHGGKLVTLVWASPAGPKQVRFVLEIFDNNILGSKFASTEGSRPVRVNGRPGALWLPDSSVVAYFFSGGNTLLERQVSAPVLVWQDGLLTYRLETDLPMDEAIRVAESLR